MMLLLLVMYLIKNAYLLLLRFFRDTLDVANIVCFFFLVKMAGMDLGRSSIFGKGM